MTDLEKMLIEALGLYADRANWSETARQDVLTGEVRADGYEESIEAELIMHDAVVWEYNGGAGYEIAQAVLTAARCSSEEKQNE